MDSLVLHIERKRFSIMVFHQDYCHPRDKFYMRTKIQYIDIISSLIDLVKSDYFNDAFHLIKVLFS